MGLNRIILCFALLCACNGAREVRHVRATLDGVETCLAVRPDSALAVLRAIEPGSLKTKKDQARAALLHSIALDKCYVDITSDSILAPALAYYRHHGTADQRLKARYYRSVLARNAGDKDTQMYYLLQAEIYEPQARDRTTVGFLHTAKRIVYMQLYDLEHAVEEGHAAAKAFIDAGETTRYYNVVLDLANLYQMQGEMDQGREMLDIIRDHWGELTVKQKGKYYAISIMFENRDDPESLLTIIEQYRTEIPMTQLNWKNLTDAYLAIGHVKDAQEAFKMAPSDGDQEYVASYYLVHSKLLEALGDNAGALKAYQQYRHLSFQRVQPNIGTDAAQVLEVERVQSNSQSKNKWLWTLSVLIASGGIVFLCYSLSNNKRIRRAERDNAQLRDQIQLTDIALRKEQLNYQELLKTIADLKAQVSAKGLLPQSAQILFSRLSVAYAQYHVARMYNQEDMQKHRNELIRVIDSREDNNDLLSDIMFIMKYTHPGLVSFFQSKNLNGVEEELCCLVIMGNEQNEIPALLNITPKYAYKLRWSIRRKLEIKDRNQSLIDYLKEKADAFGESF